MLKMSCPYCGLETLDKAFMESHMRIEENKSRPHLKLGAYTIAKTHTTTTNFRGRGKQ